AVLPIGIRSSDFLEIEIVGIGTALCHVEREALHPRLLIGKRTRAGRCGAGSATGCLDGDWLGGGCFDRDWFGRDALRRGRAG
ncbi:hypothetical protein ABTL88_19325, partial [Acinetobacter baumannii]